jgi:hypothetical protein
LTSRSMLPRVSETESGFQIYAIGLKANKPDAANPAMTPWLRIEHQWRRVADLGRSAA